MKKLVTVHLEKSYIVQKDTLKIVSICKKCDIVKYLLKVSFEQ